MCCRIVAPGVVYYIRSHVHHMATVTDERLAAELFALVRQWHFTVQRRRGRQQRHSAVSPRSHRPDVEFNSKRNSRRPLQSVHVVVDVESSRLCLHREIRAVAAAALRRVAAAANSVHLPVPEVHLVMQVDQGNRSLDKSPVFRERRHYTRSPYIRLDVDMQLLLLLLRLLQLVVLCRPRQVCTIRSVVIDEQSCDFLLL